VIEPRKDGAQAEAEAVEKEEGSMQAPDGRGASHFAALQERRMCASRLWVPGTPAGTAGRFPASEPPTTGNSSEASPLYGKPDGRSISKRLGKSETWGDCDPSLRSWGSQVRILPGSPPYLNKCRRLVCSGHGSRDRPIRRRGNPRSRRADPRCPRRRRTGGWRSSRSRCPDPSSRGRPGNRSSHRHRCRGRRCRRWIREYSRRENRGR